MSQALDTARQSSDPKAVAILAKNIYREFRAGGFSERDVMALAGELFELVARDVRTAQAVSQGSPAVGPGRPGALLRASGRVAWLATCRPCRFAPRGP